MSAHLAANPVLAFLTFIGCVGHGQEAVSVAPACPMPDINTWNWPLTVNRHFSALIPPGYREIKGLRSFDSFVGGWSGPDGSAVGFDYGRYSNTLEEAGKRPEASICFERIDGFRVYVVSWIDDSARYCAGGAWGDGPGHNRLTFTGCGRDIQAQREILALLRSVDFN